MSVVKTDTQNMGAQGLDQIEEQIIKSLAEGPGSSISEVAKRLSINRATASKYLHVLKAKRMVGFRQVGPVKLWSLGDSVTR